MSINWYPGHMHKATGEIKDMLPKVDCIIEVLDARIPYSSENPQIEQLRQDKPTIKLLNKMDLADPKLTDEWINEFQQDQSVKSFAVTTLEPDKIKNLIHRIKTMFPGHEEKAHPLNVLIMGIPNVGKSTIINTLAGRHIAKTGNEPAVTKGQQKINLNNGIMLWDSPGILWPKIENQQSGYRLAATGTIKNTAIDHDDIAFWLADYLIQQEPEKLKARYELENLPQTELEFLETIGHKRGCLASGGRVDLDKISKQFLNDFQDGLIGRVTLETPKMARLEKFEVAEILERKAREKAAKKNDRKKKFKKK